MFSRPIDVQLPHLLNCKSYNYPNSPVCDANLASPPWLYCSLYWSLVCYNQVLMRALRDFNIPKIVSDDLPVFMGLIGDLFPALNVPRKRDPEFEKIIKDAIVQLHLQAEESFVIKVSSKEGTCLDYPPTGSLGILFCILTTDVRACVRARSAANLTMSQNSSDCLFIYLNSVRSDIHHHALFRIVYAMIATSYYNITALNIQLIVSKLLQHNNIRHTIHVEP